ncbi:MAG: N-6 DNA methylase, partial [Muribaculaceae bacterium]|nr:N-6 DNA methylase [Muribaculaceae bacterium]
MDLKQYISDINQQYRTGLAREHSYRPALKNLLESLLPKMVVTNEPAHFECGAPDYIIMREKDHLPVFFVEAKDVGDNDLDGRNVKGHKEQFDRYRQALDYIIFTDYLDFHLYEHGEFVDSVRIAEVKGDKIVAIVEAEEKFLNMINHLAGVAIQNITSASRLAKLMAGKARLLARIIEQAVVTDEDKSKDANAETLFQLPQNNVFQSGLREQMETFKRVLLHDITPNSFADVYAQTIVYGLFAARLNDSTPEDFSRQEALSLIPKTSSFLRNLFQQVVGLDPDPRIEWIIDDLVTAFGATDMKKVLTSYNKDTQREDPMMHFYEDFLAAYNPALRKARGVWYTPQPVVKFIVRAIDEILQRDFGLADGLADYSKIPHSVAVEQSQDKRTADRKKHVTKELFRVQILDPSMGTGTFLYEIIKQVKNKFIGNEGIWKDYVCSYLLPRLYGFEVMMAPYTIAHMKLFLQLKDDLELSEKDFPGLNLLLTNSLEEANKDIDTLFSVWLSNEAKRASIIKRDCPVMVMIGNPPYSGESQNKGKWIMDLMQDYKKEPGSNQPLKERNPKWLNDDYVKFIRLAQHYIEKNGEGVIGFINPHGYLDNPTFRGMRWNLLKTFDKIFTIDLHGNSKKKETCPDGSKDENVFDIMQGVSINLFVKTGEKKKNELAKVYHKDLYGLRQEKYDFLNNADLDSVQYTEIYPQSPMYFFVPKNFELQEEYDKGFKVNVLFEKNSMGVTTGHDKELVSFNPFDCPTNEEYYYRPFDRLWINYDTSRVVRPRETIMRNMKN